MNNSGENSGRAKMDWDQVNDIRDLFKTDTISIHELAKKYNVAKNTIRYIIFNKTWIDPGYDMSIAEKILAKNITRAGDRNSQAKINWDMANKIRLFITENQNVSDAKIGVMFGLAKNSISLLRRNKTWYDPNWIPVER